jgi:ATP synthase protein I
MPNESEQSRRKSKAVPETTPQVTQESTFSRKVGEQEARKLKAQKKAVQGVWFGLGTMGLVGWSVVVPTLAGAALGMWIDKRYHDVHSWTLALLIAGLCVGCANAWHWVAKEEAAMREEQEKKVDD